jgi:mannose-6-phosphate isomerase-like protein (cupin superfamily)
MRKALVGLAALFSVSSVVALAQPKEAIDITDAQIKEVLKFAPPAVDQTLKVIDMGNYQLSVAIIHRGATGGAAAGRGRGAGGGAGRAAAAPPEKCGLTSAPAGAKVSGAGGIAHDDTVETYVVVSGGGTLITGGEILNGSRSPADSEVTKILNGPSCSGSIVGNFVTRKIAVGDVIVIPAGVPHGFTEITDHIDYLSIRPDPNKVLEHGYVNPHLPKS